MLEGLRHLISLDRSVGEILRDLADIFVVAFIIYRLLIVLRGTRAMQMGVGFVVFGLLYVLAKYAGLATLMSGLSWLAPSLILIMVVVFQNDIRRALIRVGQRAWLSRARDAQTRVIDEVVTATTELARHRIGALIVFERDANVMEFVKNEGLEMESLVTSELLVSLFLPESLNKLHDGAVLIRDLRIERAGVFLPYPEVTKIADPTLGTRHRAAIGITEETDAVVVVVSEERGTITLCFPNGMVQNIDAQSLRQALVGLLVAPDRAHRQPLARRMASTLWGEPAAPPIAPRPVEPASEKKVERPPSVKQSGQYKPIKTPPPARAAVSSRLPEPEESSPGESERPGAVTRVSMPMPSSGQRKSVPDPIESQPGELISPEGGVSKPMVPTALPPVDDSADDSLRGSRTPPDEPSDPGVPETRTHRAEPLGGEES